MITSGKCLSVAWLFLLVLCSVLIMSGGYMNVKGNYPAIINIDDPTEQQANSASMGSKFDTPRRQTPKVDLLDHDAVSTTAPVTLPSVSALPYPTYYFYFSQSIPSNEPLKAANKNDERNVTELENVDDSPFGHYRLPWPFILFNRRIHDLFINANGAIHLSKSQPCHRDNFFLYEMYGCTLNLTYQGVVAAFLTDLTFHNCPDPAQVVTFNTTYTATIAYRSVCYYGSKINNHFRITFDRRDHHIEVAYDLLRKNFLIPFRDYTVVGLRGFLNDSTMSTSLVTTEEDNERGLTIWRTKMPGIYPRYDEVATGKKLVYCPVTLQWCLKNETLSIDWSTAGSSDLIENILLSTLVLSCHAYVNYSLIISLTEQTYRTVLATDTTNYLIAPCITYQDTETVDMDSDVAIHHTLECQVNVTALSQLLTEQNLTSPNGTTLYLFPAWIVNNDETSSSWKLLPMNPMAMTLKDTSINFYSSPSDDDADDGSVGLIRSCQDSALCSGNYTCLDLECYQEDDPESIYSIPTCQWECPEVSYSSSLYWNSQTTASHVQDDNGTCCTISDLDCAGYCYGNSTIALNDIGATYCCSKDKMIDCKGICEGKTEYDACGICGGNDFQGISCLNFSLITFKSSYSEDYTAFYPTFYIPKDFSLSSLQEDYLDMHRIETITIQNKLENTFVLELSVMNDQMGVDPVVNYSSVSYLIQGNSTLSLSFDVSMVAMLQGIHQSWTVKSLQITYYRDIYPSAKFTVKFPIYPTVYGCEVLTRGRCMLMPGCIYCQSFPKMLLVNNHVNRKLMYPPDDEESYFNNTLLHVGRRLFNNFIPTRYRASRGEITGVCIDGWLSEDCSVNKAVHEKLANSASTRQMSVFYCVIGIWLLAAFGNLFQ